MQSTPWNPGLALLVFFIKKEMSKEELRKCKESSLRNMIGIPANKEYLRQTINPQKETDPFFL